MLWTSLLPQNDNTSNRTQKTFINRESLAFTTHNKIHDTYMHQTEWATQSSSNTDTTSDSNQTTNSFRQINITKSNHQETLSESSKMLTLMFISKECAAYTVPIQSRQHVIAQVLGRVEGERSTSPASPVSPLPACRDSTWGSGPCPPTLKHQGH